MISVGIVLDSFDDKHAGTLKIQPLDAKTLGSVVIAAPCINGLVSIPKPGALVAFADIRKLKYEDSSYAEKVPTYWSMIHNFIWLGEVPKVLILNKNQQPFTNDPSDVSDWERKDSSVLPEENVEYYTGIPDSNVVYAENNYPQVSVWKHPYGHKITLAHKVTPNGINHDGIFLKTSGGKKIQLDDAIPDNGGADRIEISDGSVTPIGPGRFILKCSDKSSELTTHGNQLFQTNVGGQDLVILQNSSADSRRENYGSGDIVDIAYRGNHRTQAESDIIRTSTMGTITDSALSSISLSSQLGLVSIDSLQGVNVTTLGPVNVLATAFNVTAGTTTMTVDPVLGTITNNGLVNQVINQQGYLINVGPNTLSITPAGVFVTAGSCTAIVTPTAITFNNGLTTATLGPASTSVNVGTSYINIGPANLDIMSVGADGIPNATINGMSPMPASFAAINSNFSNLFSQPPVADGDYGDISVTSLGTLWTVNSGTITYEKIQETSAPSVVLGRGSLNGSGTVEELTFESPIYVSGTTVYVGSGTKEGDTFLADTGLWTHIEYVKFPVKNDDSVTLNKGTPVFVTGSVGASGRTLVRAASASVTSSMPAIGLLESTLAVNGEGYCMAMGVLRGIDTSGYSYNNPIFIGSSGGITQTRPSASNVLVQNIGRVIRVHGTTGEILVMGPGRTNDVPNLISTGYLASAGTATSSTYLRGDQTWATIASLGGVTDHSALSGLSANDHPQYVLSSTNANLSSSVSGHINTSSIHFVMSSIDHTLIQNVGTNSHTDIDNHISDQNNPHVVTADQVGNSTAQWNASGIQDIFVKISSINNGEVLIYDQTNNWFAPGTVSASVQPSDIIPRTLTITSFGGF